MPRSRTSRTTTIRSDVALIRYRRLLRKAIRDLAEARPENLPMGGGDQVSSIVGPLSNDAIAATNEWQSASHAADLARRAGCPWDASV